LSVFVRLVFLNHFDHLDQLVKRKEKVNCGLNFGKLRENRVSSPLVGGRELQNHHDGAICISTRIYLHLIYHVSCSINHKYCLLSIPRFLPVGAFAAQQLCLASAIEHTKIRLKEGQDSQRCYHHYAHPEIYSAAFKGNSHGTFD